MQCSANGIIIAEGPTRQPLTPLRQEAEQNQSCLCLSFMCVLTVDSGVKPSPSATGGLYAIVSIYMLYCVCVALQLHPQIARWLWGFCEFAINSGDTEWIMQWWSYCSRKRDTRGNGLRKMCGSKCKITMRTSYDAWCSMWPLCSHSADVPRRTILISLQFSLMVSSFTLWPHHLHQPLQVIPVTAPSSNHTVPRPLMILFQCSMFRSQPYTSGTIYKNGRTASTR